jgi:hypothetical protein
MIRATGAAWDVERRNAAGAWSSQNVRGGEVTPQVPADFRCGTFLAETR